MELNWKVGSHITKRIISLDGKGNFEELKGVITGVIAISTESIGVGSPSGVIKMLNRKDLTREKVEYFHFILILKSKMA